MPDGKGIATAEDIEALSFHAANAWAAENGATTLYERSGAAFYDPSKEGTLREVMGDLIAAHLSKVRKVPFGEIAKKIAEEIGV
jgi:hypothetical protein